MKQLRFSSFRQRLNAAFLAVSLVPLLLCSALLLQIFRLRMTADQQQNAQEFRDFFRHHLLHKATSYMIRSFSAFSSAACRNRADMTRNSSPAMEKTAMKRAL